MKNRELSYYSYERFIVNQNLYFSAIPIFVFFSFITVIAENEIFRIVFILIGASFLLPSVYFWRLNRTILGEVSINEDGLAFFSEAGGSVFIQWIDIDEVKTIRKDQNNYNKIYHLFVKMNGLKVTSKCGDTIYIFDRIKNFGEIQELILAHRSDLFGTT